MSSGIVLTLIIGLLAVGKSIILPTILSRYPLMARAAPDMIYMRVKFVKCI